jgi:hypothetical protein
MSFKPAIVMCAELASADSIKIASMTAIHFLVRDNCRAMTGLSGHRPSKAG